VYDRSFAINRLISGWTMLIVLIFFVITTVLFFRAAKRYQHREFMEHRKRFFLQALGMSIAIGINLFFITTFLLDYKNEVVRLDGSDHFSSKSYMNQQLF
jgi:MFS family permease